MSMREWIATRVLRVELAPAHRVPQAGPDGEVRSYYEPFCTGDPVAEHRAREARRLAQVDEARAEAAWHDAQRAADVARLRRQAAVEHARHGYALPELPATVVELTPEQAEPDTAPDVVVGNGAGSGLHLVSLPPRWTSGGPSGSYASAKAEAFAALDRYGDQVDNAWLAEHVLSAWPLRDALNAARSYRSAWTADRREPANASS